MTVNKEYPSEYPIKQLYIVFSKMLITDLSNNGVIANNIIEINIQLSLFNLAFENNQNAKNTKAEK